MFVDTHCHLDPRAFDDAAGVDAAVARAHDAGVDWMVTIGSGYGPECAEDAVRTAERNERVYCSVGVHPHDAKHWSPDVVATLRRLAAHPKCVALGEMGLDFHYDNSPRDVQRRVLREQVALARELALPIIVHDRDSDGECLEILEAEGAFDGAGLLYHCFAGDVPMMRRIVALGGMISIPGIVTFKKADVLRDVVRETPIAHLVIETDSPFLAPVPLRGRRNEPANVAHVAAEVARLKGLDTDEVGRVTAANAARFYRVAGI